MTETGRCVERMARFLPLGRSEGSVSAIVAVLDAENLPPQPTSLDTLGATAGLSGSAGNTVGQANRGTRQFNSAEALPVRNAEIKESEALHERIRRFRQEAAVRYGEDGWIGQGPAMRLVRRQVEAASAGRSSVVLVGPPGSGRRHLAAVIHHAGCRADTNAADATILTTLDCSLLGEDVQDTLAGVVIRAEAREPSSPGTLLLHRIDELPPAAQAATADFLARRATGWRLMATAGESLVELSRRGQFQAELAAMLCVLTIELPPLARRREDLPLLAQLFLEECNAAGSRQIGGFSPEALDRLDGYSWPGNLAELAEVVAESHRGAAGREIGVADLPERLHWAAQAAAHPRRTEETIVLDEYLGRVERELIRRALARTKGNKARAARLVGMTRPRLYRRMVQLGLEEQERAGDL